MPKGQGTDIGNHVSQWLNGTIDFDLDLALKLAKQDVQFDSDDQIENWTKFTVFLRMSDYREEAKDKKKR